MQKGKCEWIIVTYRLKLQCCKGDKDMLLFLSMIETDEEKDKFVRLYNKYKYFMWYIANEVLHDTYLAEDAVQEALLALTKHLDKVEEVESKRTRNFLAAIVKTKAIDQLRKIKGTDEELDDSVINIHRADVLDSYIEKEEHKNIVNAIKKLDDIYRIVFEYKYLYGLSDREIAELIKVTPKAVNVRLFRGKKKLVTLLNSMQRGGV